MNRSRLWGYIKGDQDRQTDRQTETCPLCEVHHVCLLASMDLFGRQGSVPDGQLAHVTLERHVPAFHRLAAESEASGEGALDGRPWWMLAALLLRQGVALVPGGYSTGAHVVATRGLIPTCVTC